MKETDKKVVCIKAASSFYTLGEIYPVYKDEAGKSYVSASDGLYDNLSTMLSKFKELET